MFFSLSSSSSSFCLLLHLCIHSHYLNQSGGVGTQMIRSAFDTCVSAFNATHAVVQVLSVRDDIISWYKRYSFSILFLNVLLIFSFLSYPLPSPLSPRHSPLSPFQKNFCLYLIRLGFMQVGEPFPTYDWMKIRVENCNFVVLKKDLVEKYFHLILLLKF